MSNIGNKKILVINASPRHHGNSESLADAFIKGAKENSNTVYKFNLAQMNIRPCLGCNGYKRGRGTPCVLKDDMQQIYDLWSEADVVVFASPVYWMQFTSYFFIFRDRLYATVGEKIKEKETVLLLAATSPAKNIYHMPEEYYEYMVNTLGWKDRGRIVAGGVKDPGEVLSTPFINEAYELGRAI